MTSDNLERIDGYGYTSDLYRFRDQTIKIYRSDRNLDFRITKDVIDFLKTYRNDTFIHINDYVVDSNGIITSYTYDYVPEVKIKLADVALEYVLCSLEFLDRVAIDLAKEGISIEDNHSGNIITSPDGLVVIDPDRYEYNKILTSVKDLTIYNKKKIIGYLTDKICSECYLRREFLGVPTLEPFAFDISDTTDLSSEVRKRVKGKSLRGNL